MSQQFKRKLHNENRQTQQHENQSEQNNLYFNDASLCLSQFSFTSIINSIQNPLPHNPLQIHIKESVSIENFEIDQLRLHQSDEIVILSHDSRDDLMGCQFLLANFDPIRNDLLLNLDPFDVSQNVRIYLELFFIELVD